MCQHVVRGDIREIKQDKPEKERKRGDVLYWVVGEGDLRID